MTYGLGFVFPALLPAILTEFKTWQRRGAEAEGGKKGLTGRRGMGTLRDIYVDG